MSTPQSIGDGPSSTDPTNPATSRQNLSHSPRVIPNIPPRASFSSSQRPNMSLTPHSAPREGRSPNALKPSPKPSSNSLKKQAISPPGGHESALTAAMGSPGNGAMDSDIPSIPSPAAFDFNREGPGSGATTPMGNGGADESGWSNLGEIPDERKAQVLRRHLVSAEEREHSKTGTPTGVSPGNASPIGERGPSGGPGDSTVTYGSTSEGPSQVDDQFPIPFDALGGDVT